MDPNFKVRLKEAMERNNITATELSRRSEVGKDEISRYLKGKYSPKQDKCFLLAKALNVDAGWLMTGEEPITMKFSEMTMPINPSLIDDIIQMHETNRQKNEKRRQEELKLIHILDKLSDEGREYLLQQAEIALRAYGQRK